MVTTSLLHPTRWLLAGILCLSTTVHTQAQTAPVVTAVRGYDFLTVLVVESETKDYAKIVVVPAFQGKSEISLAEALPQYPVLRRMYISNIIQNTATVNQLLSDLTVAGWELFQVYSLPPAFGAGINPPATRYLFRKPRP